MICFFFYQNRQFFPKRKLKTNRNAWLEQGLITVMGSKINKEARLPRVALNKSLAEGGLYDRNRRIDYGF